jgi:outer membrane protein OmpA-like peptidoglycan-associated protein
MNGNKYLLTGLGVALLMCACASTPQPNPVLENARAAVQAAEADPNVSQYDAVDLETAKKDLASADAAAGHHDDTLTAQFAYLASQTARMAQLRASAKADDARVAAGQGERDKILLAERAREADNAKLARDQEAAKAARLQAEVDELKAKPTDRGLVLTLGDVLFSTGKAELNSGGTRKIDQLAQFLNEHKDRRVQVDGFTDSVGTDAYNLDLSQRRANAVQSALQGRGIESSRITTQGYGKEFPVAGNTDSGGRQLNRRVEVIIGGENNAAIGARSSN